MHRHGIRASLAALGLLAATGCATLNLKTVDQNTQEEHDSYDALCKSWLNDDVSKLIASWGAPTSVMQLPNGNSLYEWDDVDHTHVTPQQVPWLPRLQRRSASDCETRFTVTPKNVIVDYNWHATYTGFNYGCR